MEKLRKLGNRLWRNKERIVLAVMVCVWGFRMYRVLQPDESTVETHVQMPKTEIPEGMIPSAPPLMLERDRPVDAVTLVRMNPFSVVGGGTTTSSTTKNEDPGITLQRIVKWRDGTYRAEVVTKTSKTWRVSEGEQFENFTVMRIDPEGGIVEVFSNELDRAVTLRTAQGR